jgi:F-type H+-transporting ATPase subunit delta
MVNRISHRYALALFGEAEDKKMHDRVSEDMRIVRDALDEISLLRAVLHTPVVRHEVLNRIMTEIFGKHISKASMNFILMLVNKGRGAELGNTAKDYLDLLDQKQNVMTAKISSARELDAEAKKQIVDKLATYSGKQIRPEFTIDPTLRGGFIAKVGDTLIDASLQHQLEVLRQQFLEGIGVN